jgi:hypothetical protein
MIIPTILAFTRIICAEGSGTKLETDVNKKIAALENSIDQNVYDLKIHDIQYKHVLHGYSNTYAYILYEIVEKEVER